MKNNKRFTGAPLFRFIEFICKLRIPSTSGYKVHARVPRHLWLRAIHGIRAIRLIPTNYWLKFHRLRILCSMRMFFMGLDAFYSEPRALGTFGSILIILNSKLPGALSAAINIEKESRNFILHVPVSMSVHSSSREYRCRCYKIEHCRAIYVYCAYIA